MDNDGSFIRAGFRYIPPDFNADVSVSKIASNGSTILWRYTVGGLGDEGASRTVVDEYDNVFIAGAFQLSVDFDPGPEVDLHHALDDPCQCKANAFLTKLASDGKYLWTKSFRPIDGSVAAYGLARDNGGNLILGGYTGGLVDFDPGPKVDEQLGIADIFLTKLDSNGIYLWTRVFGGNGIDNAVDVAVDAKGNIYATGEFRGRADFDPGPGIAQRQCYDYEDYRCEFLLRLKPDGSLDWARTSERAFPPIHQALLFDHQDNLYYTRQMGDADVDPTCGMDYRIPENDSDVAFYLTKLDCSAPPPNGDGNGDGIVDLRDVAAYQNCSTGPPPDRACRPMQCPFCDTGCDLFDLNGEQAIDS